MASLSQEKIARKPASKQKSSYTTAYILKDNGYGGRKRGEKTRKREEAEK